jgi:hypothetical protein
MALPHETRDSGSYYEQSYLQDEDVESYCSPTRLLFSEQ